MILWHKNLGTKYVIHIGRHIFFETYQKQLKNFSTVIMWPLI